MSENLPADSQGKIIVFGSNQIRRAWVDGEWYFSVVDIVGALAESASPPKYWDAMKRREKATGFDLSTICRKVALTGADGKTYKSDTVNTENASRIIQSIPSPKAGQVGPQGHHVSSACYPRKSGWFPPSLARWPGLQ